MTSGSGPTEVLQSSFSEDNFGDSITRMHRLPSPVLQTLQFRHDTDPMVAFSDPRLLQRPLGQPEPEQSGLLPAGMGLVAILAVGAVIQYQIGKAMAPSEEDEVKWGIINATVGLVFPPTTLGLAVAKNYFS